MPVTNMKLRSYASGSGSLSFTWARTLHPGGEVVADPAPVSMVDVVAAGLALHGWVLTPVGGHLQMFRPVIREGDDLVLVGGSRYRYVKHGEQWMDLFTEGNDETRNLNTKSSVLFYLNNEAEILRLPDYPRCTCDVAYHITAQPRNSTDTFCYESGAGFVRPHDADPWKARDKREAMHLFNRLVDEGFAGTLSLHHTTTVRHVVAEIRRIEALILIQQNLAARIVRDMDATAPGQRKKLAQLGGNLSTVQKEIERGYALRDRLVADGFIKHSSVIQTSPGD
jgi:hypothetical protein